MQQQKFLLPLRVSLLLAPSGVRTAAPALAVDGDTAEKIRSCTVVS